MRSLSLGGSFPFGPRPQRGVREIKRLHLAVRLALVCQFKFFECVSVEDQSDLRNTHRCDDGSSQLLKHVANRFVNSPPHAILSYITNDGFGRCAHARLLFSLVSAERRILDGDFDAIGWVQALCLDGVLQKPISVLLSRNLTELLPSLFLGAGPTWSTIAVAGWPTFFYFSRFALAFKAFVLRRGMPSNVLSDIRLVRGDLWLQTLGSSIGTVDFAYTHTARGIADAVKSAFQAVTFGAVNSSASIASSWRSLAFAANHAENLIRDWAQKAVVRGLDVGTMLSLLLLQDAEWQLGRAVDELLLPSAMQMRMGDALWVLKNGTRQLLWDNFFASVPKASRGPVARGPLAPHHCRKLRGQQMISTAGQLAISGVHGRLPRPSRIIVMRVLRSRDADALLSKNIVTRCYVMCSPILSQLMYRQAEALAQAGLYANPRRGSPVRFVDVGAALGDCMLTAATLFPDGQLRGLAFEANPQSAFLLRETMKLNGFTPRFQSLSESSSSHSSQVWVRGVALGSADQRVLHGFVNHAGFSFVPTRFASHKIRSVTLDSQLEGMGWPHVDLMSIFTNGWEMFVLQGVSRALKSRKVDCLAVCVSGEPANISRNLGHKQAQKRVAFWRKEIVLWLRAVGYRSRIDNGWVMASPADLLLRLGWDPCDPRLLAERRA
eukprot:TRINITY_DN48418_c0_g1_i1.p1 TRINITY_DN48418_c0_g1~~TRINITY_DN48418_c0_g1_i1.p1  ORF type:complete len:665 (-),score=75.37 TRINITY_DN48418_c0_g1_i1:107-2101(-)